MAVAPLKEERCGSSSCRIEDRAVSFKRTICMEEENTHLRASGMAAHAMEAHLFPPHSNDPPLPTGQRKGATSWLDTSVGPTQPVDNPGHTFGRAAFSQSSVPYTAATDGCFQALETSRLHQAMAKRCCLHSTVRVCRMASLISPALFTWTTT